MYCSDLSLAAGEPIAGTAPHAQHFFFVRWPKTLWNEKALREAKGGWPRDFQDWQSEQSLRYGPVLTRLIHQNDSTQSTEFVKIYAYPAGVCYDNVPTSAIKEVLSTHLSQQPTPIAAQPLHGKRQFFVCTHGRHDKCCAKFGQQFYRALRELVADSRKGDEVWESSHLGGHRFAATLLEFPSGRMFGRLGPEQALGLINDQLEPKFLRGNAYREAWLQAAEIELLDFAKSQGWQGQVQIAEEPQRNEDRIEVIFRLEANPTDLWKLRLKKTPFGGPTSCSDLNADGERLLWVRELIKKID